MTQLSETKLSLTEWVVLGLIDEEPRHGFAAARELKSSAEIGQVWMVSAPLVYRAFERLESAELIERLGTEPGEKGPGQNCVPDDSASAMKRVRVAG